MYNFFSNLKKCRDNSNLYPTVEVVISSYILENYEEISLMSINLLASRCNTSISTISRFCQKILNCDFKTLKEECKNYERFLKEKEVLKKGIQKNFLYDSVEAIRETADLNSEENYQEIIKLIKRAKKVFFFGSSFSNILAQNASEKFMRLGKITVCPLTSISQEVEVNKVKNNDLVFIVSFSNKNFQMERLKYILRKKKINIVYVTANREKANEM
ncbi:MAG: MurR/RpiR family transcriptional regulator, partial [Sarcina sp.]